MTTRTPSPISVLYGLEGHVADALTGVLAQLGCTVYRLGESGSPEVCRTVALRTAADIVFCGERRQRYRELLAILNRMAHPPALVVASRVPETEAWLDALEEGAFDYCGAPFEPHLIGWILEGARLRGESGGMRCRTKVAAD